MNAITETSYVRERLDSVNNNNNMKKKKRSPDSFGRSNLVF